MRDIFADLILIIHFAFVLFVIFGWLFTAIGGALGWKWVRNYAFRLAHLAAIVFVAIEAMIGMICPLTEWEYQLRGQSGEGPGFIERMVSNILYYDLPGWVFAAAYIGFAALVIVFWLLVPPKRKSAG